MTEDEMFGWHHHLSEHEFDSEGDREGQGSLAWVAWHNFYQGGIKSVLSSSYRGQWEKERGEMDISKLVPFLL